jgi:MRG-binding protein
MHPIVQEPDGYPVGDNHPPYVAADRPHWPTDTIDVHTFPYFVADFTLPSDPIIDADIAIRRVASRESSPSHSLASSEPPTARALRGAKRKRAAATLVSGESDSSALTESGEEGTAPTTTATIEDTEDDEEDDEDASTRGVSPSKSYATISVVYG